VKSATFFKQLLLLSLLFVGAGFGLKAQSEAEWMLLDASFSGDTLLTDSLLKQEVSPNVVTYDSVTPLMYAVAGSHEGIITLLLQAGALPDLGGDWQPTPLMTAISLGEIRTAERLLQAGADPKKTTLSGESPLMRAASFNNIPVLNLLIHYSASLHQADRKGRKAVHYASRAGAWEALAYLIDQGANPCAKDQDSVQPMHIAAAYNDLALLDLLLESGCHPYTRDQKGMSTLDQAVLYRSIPVIYYILEHNPFHQWQSAQRLALKTGQRDIYQMIADSMGIRVKSPVTYATESDVYIQWNGKDHLALSSLRWIEAHSNLGISLSFGRRITPVRVLSEEAGVLRQFREKRWELLLGAHKVLSIPTGRKLVLDVRPGLLSGLRQEKYRGSANPYRGSLVLKAEIQLGFRWNRFSLFSGLSFQTPAEKEISPWYWNNGISFRFNRMNFRKFDYVL
jgi:ankyrin repeat protein